MSIWVRLIGGAHNGQVAKVDDDQVEHTMRAQLPMAAPPTTRNFGLTAASVEIKTVRYTRRAVHTPAGGIVYYALDSLSDHEALQLVLGP